MARHKGRKYQIFVKISCGFRTVQNNKSKILKFAKDVSHNFIWILYGFIVYNLESTAHFFSLHTPKIEMK